MTRTKPRWTEQGTTTPSVDGEKEGESRRDVGGRGDIDFAATNQGGRGGRAAFHSSRPRAGFAGRAEALAKQQKLAKSSEFS